MKHYFNKHDSAKTFKGPRPRLIPVLLLKDGIIVRSQIFKLHQVIGNPISTVERMSSWNVDELIILDISNNENSHDLRRDDLQQAYRGTSTLDVLQEISKVCFMPLTFGGKIRSMEDIEARLYLGADKVCINTLIHQNPELVEQAAKIFGSQCIVASIDVLKSHESSWNVFVCSGKFNTHKDPSSWAKRAESLGVGEIFLNSIDRDGSALGYDNDLIREVTKAVNIPIIACGGVGKFEDFVSGFNVGASAVAAANIFHFQELAYPFAKDKIVRSNIPLRKVGLSSKFLTREPRYNKLVEDKRVFLRLEKIKDKTSIKTVKSNSSQKNSVQWCRECVYPTISAAPMEFDENSICTGCQIAKAKQNITQKEWKNRSELLKEILEKNRSKDGSRHDVVIAVSGGKDSYYQVHLLKKVFGLNPLLVTYDGNNWTDVGWRNMLKMREVFEVDHIIIRPAVSVLKKLNRLAFEIMGDMNWHAHVGIMTVPMSIAVTRQIPLVFYGEHGYADLCGQFSMMDFPEVTYRDRLEHFARGFEWNYFVDREGLSSNDLDTWKYPSDNSIFELNLRGLFLGNYVHWEANNHIELIRDLYGFEINKEPFDRTYRTMSNLDDMHENGVHDYLKYIKFGYGRATDHASKDIRAGILSRKKAIKLVEQYDHVIPSDLSRWLEYTGIKEDYFHNLADTFRDKRVWELRDGVWQKDKIY